MRGVNRSRALVSPDCHADNSLVTAWRSGSGMAAAIVLLSGRVSETGPFLAVSVLSRSRHSATDAVPVARDSGRNPNTTIPERAPDRILLSRGYPFFTTEKCPDCQGYCLVVAPTVTEITGPYRLSL